MSTISHVAKLALDRSYRQTKLQTVISGRKLIEDMSRHHVFEDVLVLDKIMKKAPKDFNGSIGLKLGTSELTIRSQNAPIPVEAPFLSRLTKARDAEGVLGIGTLKYPNVSQLLDSDNFLLAFDSSFFADPFFTQGQQLMSLGTLLRSALAFGATSVNFVDKVPDVFSPDVVRSSQAALWTLPYRSLSLNSLVAFAKKNHLACAQVVLGDNAASGLSSKGVALKGMKGVVLLVTQRQRREFQALSSADNLPAQVAVSSALYDLKIALDSFSQL